MKPFLDENFLLHSRTAQDLYHTYAKNMPVIDYHCHLSPQQIAADHQFANLTQAWLAGDHYKWRAMRTNGVDETYCTGTQTDAKKFEQWAATVPYTLRNPLFHWTHLELQRYFGINELLNPDTAERIYEHCSAWLQTKEFSVQNLLRKMNVVLVCTTDDPVDSLEYHSQLKEEGFEIPILPAFRPDQALQVADPAKFNDYCGRLEKATHISISSFDEFCKALLNRHNYFAEAGCTVADHGLENLYAETFTTIEIAQYFDELRSGKVLSELAQQKVKTALLLQMARWNAEKGWVQQFHLGAMRNNNSRKLAALGPDTGWDSIGDFRQGAALASFLDRLDRDQLLAKTILYNLNPADNEVMATMIGNFNDGTKAGKIQYGASWWFLDQKDGMVKQMNALSNMGLLSRFVGMLTDSRSFLSFPRHEYFRRLLCQLFGEEMEQGELPNDREWVGTVIRDICYRNARQYFEWESITAEK